MNAIDIDIDLETRSSANLNEVGVYKYVDSPDFAILLFGYSVDMGPVQVVDLTKGFIPTDILEALTDPLVTKWAHSAQFERVCLGKYLGTTLAPEGWRCTKVLATELGLPGSLANLSKVMKLTDSKMAEGRDLIKLFCKPNKEGKFNSPEDYPEEWEVFKAYNKRDVEAELEIKRKLDRFPIPEIEWDYYHIDQTINDRGVRIDKRFASNCVSIGENIKEKYLLRASQLTGLENPNSPTQIKWWLEERGIKADSIDKEAVSEIIADTDDEEVIEFLKIRKILGKSSTTKYQKMLDCSVGQRAHGLIQFYGAERTGRFAGRLIQVQNLPQNHLENIEVIREFVKRGDLEELEMLFDNPTQVLSELIRTAIIPEEGYIFAVADYSAIEARVIAWLAGEAWREQAFREGKDIYCASASAMFGVPVVKQGENGHLRQKGKVAELACGYGGSVGALKAFGADKMGLEEDEMARIVQQWRDASPNIVNFWWAVDSAVRKAIKDGTITTVGALKNITISAEKGYLNIKLPSGRTLRYFKPLIQTSSKGYDKDVVTYLGTNMGRYTRLESYGPKFVENIVQAVSRDLLCNGLEKAEHEGLRPVMHVHDEIIAEVEHEQDLKRLARCMEDLPDWADGLIVRADGYVCDFYMKD